ncbi:MAG: DUF72 domain-containing protein [Actinomycetota bacterium]|nr:DUF72 domain-containing protein [Actinomycetota bacterium]
MSSRGTIRVGVSGWAYPSWRGDFFPTGLVQREELAYLAERMSSVEINGSFYSLQRPASYQRWRDATPEDFVFAVKGGRYITHMRRLRDVEVPLANFFASGVLALREKLGPVLWQLPPSLVFDEAILSGFLELLPRTTSEAASLARRHDDKVPEDQAVTSAPRGRPIRHALEVRHESFCSEPALRVLRRHDVSMVLADSAGRWPVVDEDTSDLAYVRLHGHTTLYASGYSGRSLDRWAERCLAWQQEGRDVVVYFDNDMRGRAPHDAVSLLARLSSVRAAE